MQIESIINIKNQFSTFHIETQHQRNDMREAY